MRDIYSWADWRDAAQEAESSGDGRSASRLWGKAHAAALEAGESDDLVRGLARLARRHAPWWADHVSQ